MEIEIGTKLALVILTALFVYSLKWPWQLKDQYEGRWLRDGLFWKIKTLPVGVLRLHLIW